MTQREIAAYAARILEEIQALQPVEHRDQPVPTHPNAIKEKAKSCAPNGRFAGVDLTRIDGIGTEAALTLLTEAGLDLTAFPSEKHFVSWLRLAPKTAFSAGKPLRHKKPNGTGSTRVAGVLRMAAVSLKHDRSRRRLPSQGPPQGMECRRLLHGPQAGRSRLPDAALRPGLHRHRRSLLRGSGNAASRASQMLLSPWFQTGSTNRSRLAGLFQTSPAPALVCGSFEEKRPIVNEDEPRMDTNRHEERWTSSGATTLRDESPPGARASRPPQSLS